MTIGKAKLNTFLFQLGQTLQRTGAGLNTAGSLADLDGPLRGQLQTDPRLATPLEKLRLLVEDSAAGRVPDRDELIGVLGHTLKSLKPYVPGEDEEASKFLHRLHGEWRLMLASQVSKGGPLSSLFRVTPSESVVAELDGEIDLGRQARQELNLYKTVLENSRLPMALFILEHRKPELRLMSRSFAELLGYEPNEMAALSIFDVFPDERRGWLRKQLVLAQRNMRLEWLAVEMKRKDGKLIRVDIHGNPSTAGDKTYGLLSFQDAEPRLRERDQLVLMQRGDVIRNLIGQFNHDINNQLQVAIGHLQLLTAELPGNSRLMPLVKETQRAIQLLGAHNAKLSQMSRPGSEVKEDLVPVSSEELLSENGIAMAVGRDVTLHTDFTHNSVLVMGPMDRLSQAITNVLINARDAMQGRSRKELYVATETVIVSADFLDRRASILFPNAQAGAYLRIRVQDSGSGIDKTDLLKIFEPVFSTKARQQPLSHQGFVGHSGFGLSVVKQIIEIRSGFATVRSLVNAGTTFDLYLPIVETEQTAPVKDPVEPTAVHEAPLKPARETILVAEDEAMTLRLLQKLLAGPETTVLTAENGQKALNLGKEQPIDLLITDLQMPVMGGEELITRIRQLYTELPVIIISGGNFPDSDPYPFYKDPRVTFLGKPFDLSILKEKVQSMRRYYTASDTDDSDSES